MNHYENQVSTELQRWQKAMLKKPTILGRLSKKLQQKLNSYIPEKIHNALTTAIKQMIRGVLFGANITTSLPGEERSFEVKEAVIKERIEFYKKTAAAEGGITGAGGILLGLADFPLLIGIKIKLLYDIAALYGYNTSDYRKDCISFIFFNSLFQARKNAGKYT
jgi:hypothetical protein